MFRFYIDDRELKQAIRNFRDINEIDVVKEVNWYLNQVYAYLAKTHGRAYTYSTPPASDRRNLRRRSRNLLNWLRDSRFAYKQGRDYVAGFDIPPGDARGNYLGIHTAIDVDDAEPTIITPSRAKYTYNYRGRRKILIPLRAGMDGNGVPIPITSRIDVKAMQFRFARRSRRFDWSGENMNKFADHAIILYRVSGTRNVPMYVLANRVSIPKRMILMPAFDRYRDAFYDRIESQIDKELNRVASKRLS